MLGLTTDGPYALRAFSAENRLDFPLLSDNDGSVVAAYGARYDELDGVKGVAMRATFLIDESGTVRHTTLVDADETPDLGAIRSAAAALEDGSNG